MGRDNSDNLTDISAAPVHDHCRYPSLMTCRVSSITYAQTKAQYTSNPMSRENTQWANLWIFGAYYHSKYADKEVKVNADGDSVSDYRNLLPKDRQEIRLEVS
jgi:hypothetical protein